MRWNLISKISSLIWSGSGWPGELHPVTNYKGICDWAENKDSKDQDLASENAINFFWHILTEGGWSNIR